MTLWLHSVHCIYAPRVTLWIRIMYDACIGRCCYVLRTLHHWPIWQVSPEKPVGHRHVNASPTSTHVPPLMHGPDTQSSLVTESTAGQWPRVTTTTHTQVSIHHLSRDGMEGDLPRCFSICCICNMYVEFVFLNKYAVAAPEARSQILLARMHWSQTLFFNGHILGIATRLLYLFHTVFPWSRSGRSTGRPCIVRH